MIDYLKNLRKRVSRTYKSISCPKGYIAPNSFFKKRQNPYLEFFPFIRRERGIKYYIMNDVIKIACRKLRKDMTDVEIMLWDKLKSHRTGKKFYRQKPIFVLKENSCHDRYIIADFYSPNNKLVIELDGTIHKVKKVYMLDRIKEKLLINRGYKILRFSNEEVKTNIEKVISKILKAS